MLSQSWQALASLARGLKATGDPAGGSGEREGTGARKGLLADLLWRRLVVSLEWLAQSGCARRRT